MTLARAVLFWRRCDTLCTSGFVDDMFSHNGHVARHVYSLAAIEYHKHNGRDFNQILLNDKDRKYSVGVAHREGAKSAVYEYLDVLCRRAIKMLN